MKTSKDLTCLARCFVRLRSLFHNGVDAEALRSICENGVLQRTQAEKLWDDLELPRTELSIQNIPTFEVLSNRSCSSMILNTCH